MTTIASTPPAGAAPATRRPRALVAWLTVLFAVMAIGVAAFVWQFLNGLVVTGMRNTVMWGQYILFFMFFIGLSAGGLIVASAGRLFGATMFKPITRLAVVEATDRGDPRGRLHRARPRAAGAGHQHPAPRQPDLAHGLGHHDRRSSTRSCPRSTSGCTRERTWPDAAAGWRWVRVSRSVTLPGTSG